MVGGTGPPRRRAISSRGFLSARLKGIETTERTDGQWPACIRRRGPCASSISSLLKVTPIGRLLWFLPFFFFFQRSTRTGQIWPVGFRGKMAFQRSRFSVNLIFRDFACGSEVGLGGTGGERKKRQRVPIGATQICGFLVTFYLKLNPTTISPGIVGECQRRKPRYTLLY